jgi:hypothetical protein
MINYGVESWRGSMNMRKIEIADRAWISIETAKTHCKYRVIINDCPIAVGVENPHKFWMCR